MQITSHFVVLTIALSAATPIINAQDSPPAVTVKRVPANTNPAPKLKAPVGPQQQDGISPLLKNFDANSQLLLLENPEEWPAPTAPPAGNPDGAAVPKDFRPRVDVPLSPTGAEAVRVSEQWTTGRNEPLPGPDGRVLYAYGAGLPVLVCAPLRVCIIELQPGEKIIGEPQIGDSLRWNLSPATYGQADSITSMVVLKPLESGLDTNLLVTTDRRAYYFRLMSKPRDYVARVAFSYPDEENSEKWKQHMVQQQIAAKESDREAKMLPAMLTVDKLNFSYKVLGGTDTLRPVRVFDDGAKTYIQMRPEIQNREVPALLIIGSDRKGQLTNYRIQHQTYIVDRLFDRARLVLGQGRKAQKVEITREQTPRG